MSKEAIIKKAFEIGLMIADSEEKLAMEAMQEKIKANPDAFDLLSRVQAMRADMEGKRAKGLILDETDQAIMQRMQLELNENQMIQEFGTLKDNFDNLMTAVFFTISQTVKDGNKSNCGDCNPETANCASCAGLA